MTAGAPTALAPGEDESSSDVEAVVAAAAQSVSFERLYDDNVDLVWRGLRGLGVEESNVEDAVQDVFLVVHRRIRSFEARSSPRTWLFGIVLRVARNYRRRFHRKGSQEASGVPVDVADRAPGPDEGAATSEALRRLDILLSGLDEPKREVFVLAELEQLSAREIAETLGINVNTVYSRLRAARIAFNALAAREQGGLP